MRVIPIMKKRALQSLHCVVSHLYARRIGRDPGRRIGLLSEKTREIQSRTEIQSRIRLHSSVWKTI